MYTQRQRDYYNMHRNSVCIALGITTNQYNWFRRKGALLHKIYVDYCNGDITEEQEYDDLVQPLYREIDYKAAGLGLHTYYQTDPRGATIYLDTVEIPDNNYNKAHCIY